MTKLIAALTSALAAYLVLLLSTHGSAADQPAAGARGGAGEVRFLGHPLPYWAEQAAAARRAEPTDRIVEALSLAVQSEDPKIKVAAIDALQGMGPEAKVAAPLLIRVLAETRAWIGVAAMDALAVIGKDAVPLLIQAFEKEPGAVHQRSALVLGNIGPDAREALPLLEKAAANPSEPLRDRLPGIIAQIRAATRTGTAGRAVAALPANLAGVPTHLPLAAAPGDWPQFHGPRRDAICTETGLLTEWPSDGPPLLWKLEGLGKGYSTVSIAQEKLFTMGDRKTADGTESQFAMGYDLVTRRELWAARIGPPHQDGPRCTPTVADGRVYVLGTAGDLACLDAVTGSAVWHKSLANDFGGQMMSIWKFSESPLVDGQRVICTPGGPDATMVALDKDTGATLWKCVMPALGDQGKDGAAYSSAVVAEIAGVRQYVQMLGRGAIGVEAESGRFLWGYNRIANTVANITSPLVFGDYVLATTSYKTGCALLHITRDGDKFAAEEVYFLASKDFENHHGGVVLLGGYLYGGHGQNRGAPVCLKFATGEMAWKERAPSYGSAAALYADGHLILRYDRGPVVLIEATPEAYRLKGTFTPLTADGPAWAHPVIHRGKLYLRHNDILACYDVRKQTTE
jgi:outer membrane protein assembly factor BamB